MRKKIPGLSFLAPILIAVVLLVVNSQIKLPYFIVAPGSADPVNQAIQIDPERSFKPSANVLYTTVGFSQANPLDIVFSWINPNDEIQKQQDAIGELSPNEFLEANRLAMRLSSVTATQVAMQRAGYEVSTKGDGAQIVRIAPASPAEGTLRPGETIIEVDGIGVSLSSDASRIIGQKAVGDTVSLKLKEDNGTERSAQVTLGQRPNSDAPYLGVEMQTENLGLNTPFPVNVDLGRVGGPSAGLAMTIALVDELTPGELTAGNDVAFTGTMDAQRNVGPVGGVEQKVVAVRDRSDAKVFVVPADEADQARAAAGDDLEIVGVRNLDEAIGALQARGGVIEVPPAASSAPAA